MLFAVLFGMSAIGFAEDENPFMLAKSAPVLFYKHIGLMEASSDECKSYPLLVRFSDQGGATVVPGQNIGVDISTAEMEPDVDGGMVFALKDAGVYGTSSAVDDYYDVKVINRPKKFRRQIGLMACADLRGKSIAVVVDFNYSKASHLREGNIVRVLVRRKAVGDREGNIAFLVYKLRSRNAPVDYLTEVQWHTWQDVWFTRPSEVRVSSR